MLDQWVGGIVRLIDGRIFFGVSQRHLCAGTVLRGEFCSVLFHLWGRANVRLCVVNGFQDVPLYKYIQQQLYVPYYNSGTTFSSSLSLGGGTVQYNP